MDMDGLVQADAVGAVGALVLGRVPPARKMDHMVSGHDVEADAAGPSARGS